jgi:hypothetical protein
MHNTRGSLLVATGTEVVTSNAHHRHFQAGLTEVLIVHVLSLSSTRSGIADARLISTVFGIAAMLPGMLDVDQHPAQTAAR